MPVNTENPDYYDNKCKWERIEDVLDGKAKKYIDDIEPIFHQKHPCYDPIRTQLAIDSCDRYRTGAVFINFALQTLNAITALALNTPPKVTLPASIDYLQKDITGNKLTLNQLIRKIVTNQLSVGRILLFTDFPTVDPKMDKATQQKLNIGPRMYTFNARAGINWKTRVINGVEQLSLVVITKSKELPVANDRFAWKVETVYLVLELDDNNQYVQSELDKDGKVIVAPFTPLANGKPLGKIPCTFVGSENNDSNCDKSPLETLVELNIGHLRNSAIYEDNLKRYGRGTLTVTSSLEDFDDYYKNRPLTLCTDQGYFLGESGEFKIAQLQPAQEAAVAMNQKQEQMLMIGAHIVTNNPTNISEETTRLNMGERISVLETCVNNAQDALNEHFGYCDLFMKGTPKEEYIILPKDFIKKVADPLVMGALLAQCNGGILPKRFLLEYDKSVNLIPASEKVEALVVEADNENPFKDEPVTTPFAGKPE